MTGHPGRPVGWSVRLSHWLASCLWWEVIGCEGNIVFGAQSV